MRAAHNQSTGYGQVVRVEAHDPLRARRVGVHSTGDLRRRASLYACERRVVGEFSGPNCSTPTAMKQGFQDEETCSLQPLVIASSSYSPCRPSLNFFEVGTKVTGPVSSWSGRCGTFPSSPMQSESFYLAGPDRRRHVRQGKVCSNQGNTIGAQLGLLFARPRSDERVHRNARRRRVVTANYWMTLNARASLVEP